jgi:hypothetical protein
MTIIFEYLAPPNSLDGSVEDQATPLETPKFGRKNDNGRIDGCYFLWFVYKEGKDHNFLTLVSANDLPSISYFARQSKHNFFLPSAAPKLCKQSC